MPRYGVPVQPIDPTVFPTATSSTSSTTVGVLGTRWRGTVSAGGTIHQWDGLPALTWHVAADDRWHVPDDEPSTRQSLVEGTPVVETRVRIPGGDAIQRVFATPDHGGLTIVQIENASSLPIAIAFGGAPVLSPRPPADAPIAGIDLPAGSVLFPVGHHATLTVALPHDGRGAGTLPSPLPTPLQVARGWTSMVDHASRLVIPDAALVESVLHERCELLLAGPAPLGSDVDADPVGLLLGVAEIVRCGGQAEPWVLEIADAVSRIARGADGWDVRAALDAAAVVLARAGEDRAVRDLAAVRARAFPGAAPALPTEPVAGSLAGARLVAWAERRIAEGAQLFPGGIPAAWWGQNFEVHAIPTGPASTVSFAVRWHGERPALLWERTGDDVLLSAPVAAPGWSSAERAGETLWPAPEGATAAVASGAPSGVPSGGAPLGDEPTSFS